MFPQTSGPTNHSVSVSDLSSTLIRSSRHRRKQRKTSIPQVFGGQGGKDLLSTVRLSSLADAKFRVPD